MLVTIRLEKQASICFIFGIFAYMFFVFCFLSFMSWWCWKIYLLTCLNSIGEPAYVGCNEKLKTLWKLREKLGGYEELRMKKSKILGDRKCENNATLSESIFGKHRIKWSLPNLNPDETTGLSPNLNLKEGIGLNDRCRIESWWD